MSKKSILCTVMALALVLMGTGFAYWTDTLNVTTKATTGDLDVTFADLALYAQYDNEVVNGDASQNWSIIDGVDDSGYVAANFFTRGNQYNIIAKDGSIQDYYDQTSQYHEVTFDAALVNPDKIAKAVECYSTDTNGSDSIVIEVNKMYPGYAQAFRTDILNVGSIAAKLGNINFDVKGASDVTKDMLGIALLVDKECYDEGNTFEGDQVFELCSALNGDADNFFEVGGVHFIRLSALNDADIKDAVVSAGLLATPSSNRMDLYLAVAMDPDNDGVYTTGNSGIALDSTNKDAKSQNKAAKIEISLLWDQFNQGKEVDSTNWLSRQNHN